jgi:exonuclease III
MGFNPITKNMDDKQPQIKCIQVNLKHSKAATANLMKIIEEDKTDIICIQEPYTFQSKAAGILKKIQNLHFRRMKMQGSSCGNE